MKLVEAQGTTRTVAIAGLVAALLIVVAVVAVAIISGG
jgi:hypothetical protein